MRTLSIVMGKTLEETASSLITSVHEGLVLPTRDQSDEQLPVGYPMEHFTYRFLHDKVQQAVYSLMDENEKGVSLVHRQVAAAEVQQFE